MKKRKTLPPSEAWHTAYYKSLIIKYGHNKRAILRINGIFLDFVEVEDTQKNRDALRNRMRCVNPNYPQCPQEIKDEIQSARSNRSDVLRQDQDDSRALCHLILDSVLEKAETSVLTSDSQSFTARDIVDVIEQKRKLDEYEAKLHGLVPEQSGRISTESQIDVTADVCGELPDIEEIG